MESGMGIAAMDEAGMAGAVTICSSSKSAHSPNDTEKSNLSIKRGKTQYFFPVAHIEICGGLIGSAPGIYVV